MKVKVKVLVMSDCLQPYGLQPARFLCPWDFPGKTDWSGFCSFLQGIFLTQGSNLGVPHCEQILYRLSHNAEGDSFSEIRFLNFYLRFNVPVGFLLGH